MKTTPRVLHRLLAFGTPLIAVAPVAAQDADTENAEANDEVYIMSPFEVTSEGETGYMATSTLAGTRIRTDLADVGSAITVVTQQMLTDLGATDNGTLLQYTANAEVTGTRSIYAGLGNGQTISESFTNPGGTSNRIRGLSAADNVRDFFASDIPWDSYATSRVDIQRGANSILFGLGSPAGIINAGMDAAQFVDSGELSLRMGSYGSLRGSIDLSQQIIENVLAVRIEGLWDHQKYQQSYAHENDERIFGAIRWEPVLIKNKSFHTTIKANFEHGDIEANRPRTVPPIDNISAWFRDTEVTEDNPYGGMGKLLISNSYDAEASNSDSDVSDGKGVISSTDVDYNAYVSAVGNQQTPFYFFEGSDGTLYSLYGGYINPGSVNADGTSRKATDGIYGKQYSDILYSVKGLPSYASDADLEGNQYGQYKNQTMTDSSIFDFYNILLDGPNKAEWEDWNAYNISFSQTGLDDRIGLEIAYDHQKYNRGAWSLLGGSPQITIDYLETFQDGSANENVGRAYVTGSSGASTYESERDAFRANLFGELRADDFIQNEFLAKLIGRHRFNVVFSKDRYEYESKGYEMYSKSLDWDNYWNGDELTTVSYNDREPVVVIYIGNSLLNQDSASGANLPGITATIEPTSGYIYTFDSTWNSTVDPSDPWEIPSSMAYMYNFQDNTTPLQNSNSNNYVGWNSDYYLDITKWTDDYSTLCTSAKKDIRDVQSTAGTWQSFWWDGALVGTIGWRYDSVKTKSVSADNNNNYRDYLNLTDEVWGDATAYAYPEDWTVFTGHSLSWSSVLHLNKLLPNDPLPFKISLSFNRSDNFQVSSQRVNLLGEPLAPPSGETTDYGITIGTKDNRFVFRAVMFDSTVKNASCTVSSYFLTATLARGWTWASIMEYDLDSYAYSTASSDPDNDGASYRFKMDPGDGSIPDDATDEEAQAWEDASVALWKEMYEYIDENFPGFTEAWGCDYYEKVLAKSVDSITVSLNAPSGYTMTSDQTSEGYEFELTANITSNWRMSVNCSKTTASETNIGGTWENLLVAYLDEMMATKAGDMEAWGGSTCVDLYNAQKSGWTLAKLQDGAAMSEIRKWKVNALTNYTFSKGLLKGFGVGAAYRWQDKCVIGYPVVAIDATNYSYDLNSPYYGPYENQFDMWVSYETKLNDKVSWTIQLNVSNMFGKDKLVPISVQPDGETWASAKIEYGAEWYLTSTFRF